MQHMANRFPQAACREVSSQRVILISSDAEAAFEYGLEEFVLRHSCLECATHLLELAPAWRIVVHQCPLCPKVSVAGASAPPQALNAELECQKKMRYFLTYEKRFDIGTRPDYETRPRWRARRRFHA